MLPLCLSNSVQKALERDCPIVALESTVITHGLPYPQSFELLNLMEELVLAQNAIPATIIVWEGKACIGLEERQKSQLREKLSQPDSGVKKLGSRELALAFARAESGGTTVSATMRLAYQAGIEVFATGGIGGIHRGWQQNLDISMDLESLARIPMLVVSAGSKAILDIPATLEHLESMGVPVIGWQTDRFPLFYTSSSEHKIDRADSLDEIAKAWRYHLAFKSMPSAMLIANPIPAESQIPASQIEPLIEDAIITAAQSGTKGKALTPFLLDYLAGSTKSDSIKANLALLKNNATLAAKIASRLKEKPCQNL